MALAAPVLEQTYRYPFPSALVGSGERRRLRLATSGGPAAEPAVLPRHAAPAGRRRRPPADARRRRSVAVPRAAADARPDPRCSPTRSRPAPTTGSGSRRSRPAAASTAGSTCCPRRSTARSLGRGTTNVDFGPGIRSALAGVQDRSRLGLSVGASAVEVDRRRRVGASSGASRCRRAGSAGSSRSRRSRPSWRPRPSSMPPGTRAFFRSIPKSPSKRPGLARPGRPRPADRPSRPRAGRRRPGRPRPPAAVRAGRPPRDGAPGLCRRRRRQHRLAARRARAPA